MAEPLRLGDHCEKIGSGATPRGGKETYSDDGPVALIRSQNVHNDRFSHAGLAFISQEQADQLQNVSVKEGDILLNITGDSVARVCQVDSHVLPARVNQHVAIIRPRPERIDPLFLRYYLVTPAMQAHMLGLAAAGATRNALTKSMIEGFRVPDLPLNHQTAIASVLGALDDKIDLNRRMNETLEAMARAIFKDWFIDFGPTRAKMEGRAPYLAPEIWSLFPERLDEDGKPEGWERVPLKMLIEVNPSEPLVRGKPAPYLDMASIPTSGPNPQPFVLREFGSGMRFRNGDALLARITPCLENGKTAFVQNLPEDEIGWGSTEFIVLRSLPPIPKPFSYLVARDPAFRANAIRSMTGTSGRQRASGDAVSTYPIVQPSNKDLWQQFGDIVDPAFKRISTNDKESQTLSATRDLLLPKLMSGEVRVKDVEKQVGEAT